MCLYVSAFNLQKTSISTGGREEVRGGGRRRGGWGCSAQVQRRIIVGPAVSAVTVHRPKQLRSPHPHYPLPLYPPLSSPTSKGACGTASAELAGLLGLQHSGPSIVYTVWTPHSKAGKPPTLFCHFSRCLTSGSLTLWHGTACHWSFCLCLSWCYRLWNSHLLAWLAVQADGQGSRRNLPWQMLPWSLLWSALRIPCDSVTQYAHRVCRAPAFRGVSQLCNPIPACRVCVCCSSNKAHFFKGQL